MTPDEEPPTTVFVVDGYKTLPLYTVFAKSTTVLPAFGKGRAKIEYVEPSYVPTTYGLTSEWIERVSEDVEAAKRMVSAWKTHQMRYLYYVQFKDDDGGEKAKSLHAHTSLVSAVCDNRLNIDTTGLWETFDVSVRYGMVHSDYRADNDREGKYQQYASRLKAVYEGSRAASLSDNRLLERILSQIDLKAAIWRTLPPLRHAETPTVERKMLRIFYSYSHKDEQLRNKLESHLAVLKRNELIENWHDRKIGAGNEWKGAIDSNLEAAAVILLLVSANFLNSDYCYDVEVKRAMERHEHGSAKVVPIILRPCDWTSAPFGRLQALPTDARAVTDWPNRDKAFTDIAKGLSDQVRQLISVSG